MEKCYQVLLETGQVKTIYARDEADAELKAMDEYGVMVKAVRKV